MSAQKIFTLVICLVAPLIIGGIGGYFTYPAISSWYVYLQKPIIAPPNWVFGPVWTLLYILMGISSYIVFKNGIKKKNIYAFKIYSLQLLLNLLWSIVFFGFHSILGGLVVIIILWILIFINIRVFKKISKKSALLLYPYICWVSFASILNFLLLSLNK